MPGGKGMTLVIDTAAWMLVASLSCEEGYQLLIRFCLLLESFTVAS
jgi:hypothetical protein